MCYHYYQKPSVKTLLFDSNLIMKAILKPYADPVLSIYIHLYNPILFLKIKVKSYSTHYFISFPFHLTMYI